MSSRGAPAAQGCSIEGGRRLLLLGGIPLREAPRLSEGGTYFWWSSHCAGLLD